jgi:hypothetical protein
MAPQDYVGVDIEELKRDREAHEGGVGASWPEGDTRFYVLGRRDGYKVNYAEYAIHRVGQGQGETVICFNPKRNKILKNELFLKLVAERGIKVPKVCKICQKVEAENLWDTNKEEAQRIGFKSRFVWLIIMWATRKSAKDDWQDISPKRVKPYFAPKAQWDEICDYMCDAGDITNPDKAKLMVLHREGTKTSTRYSAKPDIASAIEQLIFTKEQRAVCAKALAAPELVYEKLVADLVVSQEEIDALMQGVKTVDSSDDTPDDAAAGGDKKKECFGNAALYNPSDDECRTQCQHTERCRLACEAVTGKVVEVPAAPVSALPPAPEEPPPHTDAEAPADEPAPEEPSVETKPSFEDLEPTGTLCSLCKTPQAELPDGQATCANGHTGAPAYVKPPKAAPAAAPAAAKPAPAPAAAKPAAAPAPAPAAAPPSKAAQASEQKTTTAAKGNATRLDALLASRSAKK